MIINIIKSRKLFRAKQKNDWEKIIYTILATSKTLSSSKINKITYVKKFSDFTLEVSTLRYENNLYVLGVNKNGRL